MFVNTWGLLSCEGDLQREGSKKRGFTIFCRIGWRKEARNLEKNYNVIPIGSSRNLEKDAEELARVIKVWTDDGAVLHSVIPRVYESETEGYLLIVDTTEVE